MSKIIDSKRSGPRLTSSQMSTIELGTYDILLNEFPAYFGKCYKLSSDISQNMLEIHSKYVTI